MRVPALLAAIYGDYTGNFRRFIMISGIRPASSGVGIGEAGRGEVGGSVGGEVACGV